MADLSELFAYCQNRSDLWHTKKKLGTDCILPKAIQSLARLQSASCQCVDIYYTNDKSLQEKRMPNITPKIPTETTLSFIRSHLTYNPDTGLISREGKPTGSRRKKDGCIIVRVTVGKTEDGDSIHYTGYASQVGWYLTHGVWPGKWIDHIDGDRSNNRLSNLRLVTPSQNSHNQRKVKSITSSKFKGVKKVGKKWRAYINHEGKMLHLGYHLTEEEAAIAYDTKALEVFGAYAKCNFGGNSAISEGWVQLELPFVI